MIEKRSMLMLSLIYISAPVKLLREEELLEILKISRENNVSKQITGMLLYKGGNFMQVLEGPDDAVNELFEKIKKDPRHHGVSIILSEQIETRQFPNWEMAFVNLDNPAIKNEPNYSQFLEEDFTSATYLQSPSRAKKLLLNFREYMS